MNTTTTLNFTLTLDEANQVLLALSKEPYGQVAGLVSNLQGQAQKQLSSSQPITEA
jgi:hypothetical protein